MNSIDIQHLRRVVKPEFVPEHIQRLWEERSEDDEASTSRPTPDLETRFFLICPEGIVPLSSLEALLAPLPPFCVSSPSCSYPLSSSTPSQLRIRTVPVPLFAPISAAQASAWSTTLWPISYKNTNPHGPHPALLARATADTAPRAPEWLALALTAAFEAAAAGDGEPFGCAIVDGTGPSAQAVAVAADARHRPTSARDGGCAGGNVLAHAALRAIGMVARKRARAARGTLPPEDEAGVSAVFLDGPLHAVEREVFARDNVGASGYLCAGLDVYMTHEPCVMCAMAMLHSRVRRCVFGRRVPATGGMTADSVGGRKGLEQGIFWRPAELNWKFLAWEWVEENGDKALEEYREGSIHV